MFSPIYQDLVAAAQRQDRLREAEKERLLRSIAASSRRRPIFSSLFEWFHTGITRLRCALFPSRASPICTS